MGCWVRKSLGVLFFSAKLSYEEDFFERISRILYFFVMFWHSIRNVVIVSVSGQPRLAVC
jgi:hypothetical protein